MKGFQFWSLASPVSFSKIERLGRLERTLEEITCIYRDGQGRDPLASHVMAGRRDITGVANHSHEIKYESFVNVTEIAWPIFFAS
jgi:hypothetical protein